MVSFVVDWKKLEVKRASRWFRVGLLSAWWTKVEVFLLQKAGRNRKASFFKDRVKDTYFLEDTDGEGEHSM